MQEVQKTTTSEKKGNAKLKNTDVLAMRQLHSSGLYSLEDLAAMYHLSHSYIWQIIKGRLWKSVPGANEGLKKKQRKKCGPYKKKIIPS